MVRVRGTQRTRALHHRARAHRRLRLGGDRVKQRADLAGEAGDFLLRSGVAQLEDRATTGGGFRSGMKVLRDNELVLVTGDQVCAADLFFAERSEA